MGWAAAFLFLSVAIMNGVEWRKVAFRRETLRWRGATEESESDQRLGLAPAHGPWAISSLATIPVPMRLSAKTLGGVVWVGGAGGGLDGPARGLYP